MSFGISSEDVAADLEEQGIRSYYEIRREVARREREASRRVELEEEAEKARDDALRGAG